MRVDSHQHFWRYQPSEYPWMKEDWPIRRDFLPGDLEPWLASSGLTRSVAVQARQSLEESRWLLDLAERHPSIAGVVGWVDLRNPAVARDLEPLAAHPKFVGVRHVVQDEPDEHFMLQPAFLRGLETLQGFDLAYDFLVFPHQLPAAIAVARRFPKQRFVLDHLAKPRIAAGEREPWTSLVRQLAECSNVACKISGLVTEARWKAWSAQDFEPYLEVVFEAFGPRRLMFGSDWPVCLLAGSYADVYGLARDYVARRDPAAVEAIFGMNAVNVYRLPNG
ncbi:MAG: amidohydrolase [Verrucomicrobia bacterium]|nr:amidohydrolase [Verrucomicrobiota bacterium]